MFSQNDIGRYEKKMGEEIRELYWKQERGKQFLVESTLGLYYRWACLDEGQMSQQRDIDWIQAIEIGERRERELHEKRRELLIILQESAEALKYELIKKISQNTPSLPKPSIIQPSYCSMQHFLSLNEELNQKVSSQLLLTNKIRKQLSAATTKITSIKQNKLKKIATLYTIKNNLHQYLACLQKLQSSLHSYSVAQNQEHLQDINRQISYNGFQIAPDLFQTHLCRICLANIYQQGIELKISKWRNLQIIINSFMVSTPLQHQQTQIFVESEGLYNLCKNFLKLSTLLTYTNTNQHSQSEIAKVCLPKISQYISKYSQLITKKQFWKVKSLCQSNKQLQEFIQIAFQQLQYINQMQIDSKLNEFERRLSIIRKGETIEGFHGFIEEFQEEEFMRFYKKVEERAWVYNELMISDIFQNLISGLLRILYFPLLYLIFVAVSGQYETKQGRRYQKIRLMHRHIDSYQALFKQMDQNEKQEKVLQANTLNPKIPKPTNIKSIKNGTFLKELSGYVQQKAKHFKMNYKQINNAAVDCNQKFGGTVLFLINKLAVLKNTESEKGQKVIRDNYIGLWVEMIAELCFVAMKYSERECRYPLKDLKFFKEKILQSLEQKFMIETKMDSIVDFFRNKQHEVKKKPSFLGIRKSTQKEQEKFKQKLYSEIMSVNIRTCQYVTLMKMAKYIGQDIVSELLQGHRSFYYSIFK